MSLHFQRFAPIVFFTLVMRVCAAQHSATIHFSFHQTPLDRNPPVQWFLNRIREEEKSLQLLGIQNRKDQLTNLRKLYYHSPAFDKHLIKTTERNSKRKIVNIQVERENYSRSVPTAVGMPYTIDDLISVPSDEQGTYHELRKDPLWSQEITIDSISVCDIGHVLCGMDAANYPSNVRFPFPFRFIKINSNLDAITWVGDLGSIVSENYYLEKIQKKMTNPAQLQQLVNDYSAAADNLGNVHSFFLGQLFAQDKEERHCSDLLEDFFCGKDITSDSLRRYSFVHFANSIGLEWQGQHFKNEAAVKRKYAKEVGNAAAMYLAVAARRKGVKNLLLAFPSILKLRRQPVATILVDRYFTALREEILTNQRMSSK